MHIQISSHKLHNVVDLLVALVLIGLEAVLTVLFDRDLHISGPMDGVDSEDNLAGPLSYPTSTRSVVVSKKGLLTDPLKTSSHSRFDFKHPLFNISLLVTLVDIDLLVEFDFLSLSRDHAIDFIAIAEHNAIDTFKALVHMRLDGTRLLGLGEKHEQVLIGQEVETGEKETLLLEDRPDVRALLGRRCRRCNASAKHRSEG